MVDELNTERPVSLKYNEDLVNRVYARYPVIDKSEVGLIIKAVFSSIRDLWILGNVLNFNNLFLGAKLHFFQRPGGGRILPSLKVRLATPPHLRNYEKK
jgi:hypothetical protein